jgi:hypothetical protein
MMDPRPKAIEQAVAEEREACARIAEQALLQLTHGHGADPYGVVCAIVERIRGRSQQEEGAPGSAG